MAAIAARLSTNPKYLLFLRDGSEYTGLYLEDQIEQLAEDHGYGAELDIHEPTPDDVFVIQMAPIKGKAQDLPEFKRELNQWCSVVNVDVIDLVPV